MTATEPAALLSVLRGFGIEAEVAEVQTGAAVDRIALKLAPSVRVKQVTALADDIALSLGASGVRVYPIPGTRYVGVEVPAAERKTIPLDQLQLTTDTDHPLRFPVGASVDGKVVTARFDKLPHLIVAGTTGSGKSVFVNSLLAHLVERNEPATLQLMLIDPKRVELAPFAGVPHLARPVATDVHMAVDVLDAAVAEMDARWIMLEEAGKKNVADLDDPPPYLLVVIDELADLMMMAGKRAEPAVVRLLQLGRAAGVHLLLATQRPSTDVITGLIKTNAPSRMVFKVSSHTDSNVALGRSGAETLLGLGDGLWFPSGASQPERVQGAFLSDDDLAAVLDHVGTTSGPDAEEVVALGSDVPIRTDPIDESFAWPPEAPAPMRRDDEELAAYKAQLDKLVHEIAEMTATPLTDAPTAPTPEEPAPIPEWLDVQAERDSDMARIRGEVIYTNDREEAVARHYYDKGRRHGAIVYGANRARHRSTLPRDWAVAILIFLAVTAGSLLAFPILPLVAGGFAAWTALRRRTRITYNLEGSE